MNNRLFKRISAIALCAAMCVSLAACGEPEETPDPHEGMAYVNTGANYEWITPAEGVAVSDFSEDEFTVGEDGPARVHRQRLRHPARH